MILTDKTYKWAHLNCACTWLCSSVWMFSSTAERKTKTVIVLKKGKFYIKVLPCSYSGHFLSHLIIRCHDWYHLIIHCRDLSCM